MDQTSRRRPMQVLVFLRLARLLNYPDAQALEEDMTQTDLDTFRRTN